MTTSTAPTTPIVADLDEAKRFLALLDPDPDTRFGFATFDDDHERADYRQAMRLHGTLDRVVRLTGRRRGEVSGTTGLLGFMQGLGAGVFVTIQALDGDGATGAHVSRIRAFHADADTEAQRVSLGTFIQRSGLVPSILVASGGLTVTGRAKVQAYWLVADCPVDDFEAVQALLLTRCGTDPAARDLARVLRLPGFVHQKVKGSPRLTRILADGGPVYGLADFTVRVRALPKVQEIGPATVFRGTRTAGKPSGGTMSADRTARLRELLEVSGGIVTPAVATLIAEAVPPVGGNPGNRHPTLMAIVARLAQRGWSDLSIRRLVLDRVNVAWGDGDWGDHLDRMLAWVRERERRRDAGLGDPVAATANTMPGGAA
jgi:hypothetical protein